MSVRLEDWQPKRVEKMVEDQLLSRAEDVGKFVETEARKRLYQIKTPDTKRDRNYRHYLAKFILTHRVEQEVKAVVIRVGMKIGKQGQTHHGFYIETGSRTAPAQPYLRPAVLNNTREIMQMLKG